MVAMSTGQRIAHTARSVACGTTAATTARPTAAQTPVSPATRWQSCVFCATPACIAPRRWYDWAMQQVVLLLLLAGGSLHQGCRQTGRARSTARRWQDWLHARSAQFTFFLRSRLPELGRLPEPDFWLQVIASMSLTDAMTQLDQDLVVP